MRSGGASRPSRGCTGSRARRCCPPRARATRSGSLGTLQDIDQVPALPTRQRPALDNAHHVPLVGVVVLVVRVQRARAAHDLLVAPVAARNVDPHDDRLLALVRDHYALAHLALALRARLDGGELPGSSGRGLAGGRGAPLPPARPPPSRPYAAAGRAVGVALLGGAGRSRLTGVPRASCAAPL